MDRMLSGRNDKERPSRFKDKMRLAVAGATMLGAGAVGEAPVTHQSFIKTAEAAPASGREGREGKIFDLSSPVKALGSMQGFVEQYKSDLCRNGSPGCIDAFGAGEAHLFRAGMLLSMVAMTGNTEKQKADLHRMVLEAIQLANQRFTEAIDKYTAEKVALEKFRADEFKQRYGDRQQSQR